MQSICLVAGHLSKTLFLVRGLGIEGGVRGGSVSLGSPHWIQIPTSLIGTDSCMIVLLCPNLEHYGFKI